MAKEIMNWDRCRQEFIRTVEVDGEKINEVTGAGGGVLKVIPAQANSFGGELFGEFRRPLGKEFDPVMGVEILVDIGVIQVGLVAGKGVVTRGPFSETDHNPVAHIRLDVGFYLNRVVTVIQGDRVQSAVLGWFEINIALRIDCGIAGVFADLIIFVSGDLRFEISVNHRKFYRAVDDLTI